MNMRFHRGVISTRIIIGLAAVLVVLLPVVAGRSLLAQEKPKRTEDAHAKERQLRVPPLAAGRDKAALAEEAATAQSQADSQPAMDVSQIDCRACHECDNPTREDPCLRMCPRAMAEALAGAAPEQLPDDVILLNAFEWQARRFMPVPFTHKLHADMAEMTGGCEVCHHHTAPGGLYPPCQTCHKPVFLKSAGEEMRVPNLKGAYHRQCMGCHRDWSHSTKCSICHLPKGDQTEPTSVESLPARGDVAGHPPIENPEHILRHTTEHESGPYVLFRHQEHIKLYGYDCAQCHRGQTCARCHESAKERRLPTARPSRLEQHGICFPCHEDDKCERCHSKSKLPAPQRFDHATTGFALGKYHGSLTCRTCHKRLYFIRKLQGECAFCHTGWGPDTFNHAVTGQILDDNHVETDCEECHIDRKFDAPPTCDECHDEDEGIAFPRKRPGPVMKAEPAAKP